MKAAKARSAYQQSEAQAKIHPVRLIQLIYERLLTHLEIAEEGILENDAKKRGENLSRAIALVTELVASIKENDNSEAAVFLRGLYAAILTELPKAVISNDVEIVRIASRYIQNLQKIWEETAVAEADLVNNQHNCTSHPTPEPPDDTRRNTTYGGGRKYGTASVGGLALASLSVSI
ncbi:MAG: flagellar export chaperone FliS [Deltaproteobacteria bacterium]|nr:flagellar export chaperone FliS [Deltaproteobacteria bacterium]